MEGFQSNEFTFLLHLAIGKFNLLIQSCDLDVELLLSCFGLPQLAFGFPESLFIEVLLSHGFPHLELHLSHFLL